MYLKSSEIILLIPKAMLPTTLPPFRLNLIAVKQFLVPVSVHTAVVKLNTAWAQVLPTPSS